MPTYHCDYISNGERYSCRVKAGSAVGALETLQGLSWAPGCGPVGTPQPLAARIPVADTIARFVAAAVVIAGLGAVASLSGPGEIRLAANEGPAVQETR